VLVPFEPLFVDRARELAEFDVLLEALAEGRRNHLALLGLRRIGKTMLLDEVRRRHPDVAIAYLALDEIVSTPEELARALVGEIVRVAGARRGIVVGSDPADDVLRLASQRLGANVLAAVDRLRTLMQPAGGQSPSYGALLTATMRFPAVVSDALDLPLLVMLDEFQELTRLRSFPNTDNLLGAMRAALDRRGKVGYVAAGSRVTALRALLSDGESPLFTRFRQLDLLPFSEEATHDLATRVWDDDGLSAEPDAAVRLQRLTGGWPFYVQAVASRASHLARGSSQAVVTPDLVDEAFWYELIGRAAAVGQQCRYLLDAALRSEGSGGNGLRNTIDAVLRRVARGRVSTRTSLARSLSRHHAPAQVFRAINRLIDTDFLREEGGELAVLDPVFALWLRLEPARRDPARALADARSRQRMLAWYEAQHAQDREEMGTLFERRVENLARQFRGQSVDGRLFGVAGPIRVPRTREAGTLLVDDATGQYGERPDTYQVDVVTVGDDPEDCWAIEAKHRRGAITRPMVERFLHSARVVEQARSLRFAHLWIVAPRGIRADAAELTREHGMLTSGLRQLERLERQASASFDAALAGEV
jgi:hypothetical protein